jgi:hypothetical protein
MWPGSEVLSRHPHGGTGEGHENISQDSRSPGQDLNPEPPEYEAGVLTKTFSSELSSETLVDNCFALQYITEDDSELHAAVRT